MALIGAHTIGKVRVEFGSDLAGPWVPGGDDAATTNGPSECLLFDFALWFNSWHLLFCPKHTCCEPTLIHFALLYVLQSLITNITIG